MQRLETFCRYRIEPHRWMFTDVLKAAATVRFDLIYRPADRRFAAEMLHRHSHFSGWSQPEQMDDEAVARLRALLPPSDIAACVAASMIEVTSEAS